MDLNELGSVDRRKLVRVQLLDGLLDGGVAGGGGLEHDAPLLVVLDGAVPDVVALDRVDVGARRETALDEPASEVADTALEFLAPAGPTPYTLTEGTPGPTTLGTEGDREVVVGKKSPSGGRGPIGTASEPGTTSSSSSGPPWYGSHLSVGRRP